MDYETEKMDETKQLPADSLTVALPFQAWIAWRRAAGRHIDPDTAEVTWRYAQTIDPYGVCPELAKECDQVGREYFARSPDNDLWISFHDLPDATRDALWAKYHANLAFPAGLPTPTEKVSLLELPPVPWPTERATYSIAEACAVAGIRRTSLYKAIRAGALRAIKIGRRTFIAAADLQRWLDGMPAIVPKAPTKSDVPAGTP